jgi:chemotaxis protein methyltransferase CheR
LLRHACDAFFYQKHDRALGSYGRARGTSSKTSSASSSLATKEPLAGSWADAIEQAATRVHALTTPLASARALTAQPAAGRKSLDRSFELLASERFDEALDALPDHSDGDPDVLLLRAALLVHSGKLEAAKRTSSALLEIDAFNVGAHYLLALCSDGAGERSGALEHDRIALHLEPTFAMAHLHLGLIARRDGDHPTARRELSTALSLLPREESARILLYGGGFSRAALVELCKSELIAAGVAP